MDGSFKSFFTRKQSIFGLLGILLFLASLCTEDLLSETPDWKEAKPFLEESLTISGLDGLGFLTSDSKTQEIHGIGKLSKDSPANLSPDTLYPLGNLGEFLLRVWFFRMEALGKLNLQDPIQTYLPDEKFGTIDKSITILQLLNSSSGLSFRDDRYFINKNGEYITSLEEINFLDNELHFGLGDHSQNSVMESILLRQIIQNITKNTYLDTIKKDVLLPLGIQSFSFKPSSAKKKTLVSFTYFFSSKMKVRDSYTLNFFNSVLQIYGNLEDVGKLFAIISDPKSTFLKPEQKVRFFNPITFADDSSVKNYSYGFRKQSLRSIDFYFYPFYGEGSSSTLLIVPSKNLSIFLVTNINFQPGLKSISINFLKYLLFQEKEFLIENCDDKIYSLVGLSQLILTFLLMTINSFIVIQIITQTTSEVENKMILMGKFLISLGSFLFLVWFRFLALPNIDSFSHLTSRFDSTSFHGWKIEVYFGFLALLVCSFLYVLTYSFAITKYNFYNRIASKKVHF
jgi:CubicO group peptidase (beta-lactamase class C family)